MNEMSPREKEADLQKRIAYQSGMLQSDITVWTLLQSIAESVVIVNESGRILLVNKRLESFLGYTTHELIGQDLSVLLPEKFRARHGGKIAEFFREPRIRPMGLGIDLSARKKDGSEMPVEISLSYLNTNVGQLAMAFLSDISERKKVEEKFRDLSQHFEHVTNAMATDLDRSLNDIIDLSEQLKKAEDNLSKDQRAQYLNVITENGRLMGEVIRELVFFSRLKNESPGFDMIPMDAVLRRVLSRLTRLIADKQASVEVDFPLINCLGNFLWIEEIFYNVVSNAIRFGGAPPIVRISSTTLENGAIRYIVTDNGKGFDHIETAWNESVRQSDIDSAVPPVRAWGLSIIKGIAQKLHAHWNIAALKTGGSSFTIDIPTVETTLSDMSAFTAKNNKNSVESKRTALVLNTTFVSRVDRQINELFESKQPYLNPDYSLPMMAAELELPVHQLSAFINEFHQCRFNAYINKFRINRIVREMKEKEQLLDYTVEGLALVAGFNSRQTFIQAFKAEMRMTPSSFLTGIRKQKKAGTASSR